MSFKPNNPFEEKFRQFLAEPGTQDVIRADQEKEIGIMKKIDEFQSLEELQGQREQLAVALQANCDNTSCAHACFVLLARWSESAVIHLLVCLLEQTNRIHHFACALPLLFLPNDRLCLTNLLKRCCSEWSSRLRKLTLHSVRAGNLS